MNYKSASTETNRSLLGDIISWLFGILVLAMGLVNTFWGNDTGFGIFLILLFFVYFPPANVLLREWTGLSVPLVVKIILGVFIIWAALGVGELFDKIGLMMKDL